MWDGSCPRRGKDERTGMTCVTPGRDMHVIFRSIGLGSLYRGPSAADIILEQLFPCLIMLVLPYHYLFLDTTNSGWHFWEVGPIESD